MLNTLKSLLATTFLAAPLSLSATAGSAATFTLDATSRGCLESDGSSGCGGSFSATGNYFTGEDAPADERLRSFFLFDLSSVSGTVTDVSLNIFTGTVLTEPGPESVGFFQISQSSFDALEGGAGSAAIYSDLGTGVNLGGPTIAASGGLFNFAGGVDWINAVSGSIGGDFGFGGSLLTYDSPEREGVFGGTLRSTFQLVVETATIPLPAGLPLLLAGLGGLAFLRRRR